jgi:hypothetical protein
MLGGALATLAATPALVATGCVPVLASTAEPDAHLIELGRQYMVAFHEREAFYKNVVEPAESRFNRMVKDAPGKMLVGPADLWLLGVPNLHTSRVWVAGPGEGGKWVEAFSPENVEYLRANPRTCQDRMNMTKKTINGRECFIPGAKPDVRAQARADEIVAEYDNREAATKLAREQSGLAKADAEYDRLFKVTEELLLKVVQYPASTFRGFIIQAHCAEQDLMESGGFERQFTEEMKEEGSESGIVSPTAAAFAIARNLSRLAKQGALS